MALGFICRRCGGDAEVIEAAVHPLQPGDVGLRSAMIAQLGLT